MILHCRKRILTTNLAGYHVWERSETKKEVCPERLAIILCDVWDAHWSHGANERLALLLPSLAMTVKCVREMGAAIIHAPSSTIDFYEGTPARQRILDVPMIEPQQVKQLESPALPVDSSGGGSDTQKLDNPDRHPWRRQHKAIEIDQHRDVISDDGPEIYSYLQHANIQTVVIMGVHTNCCILGRSFAIKNMVSWGVDMLLCRDLTDAMYNPAQSPYVSHEEGTQLVINYIESFWCPTIESKEFTASDAKE